MFKKQPLITLSPSLAQKTIKINQRTNQVEEIKEYFVRTYQLYQQLFLLINQEKAYYIKAQPLRHPLIFYYGHTACLFVNKMMDAGILKERINRDYEKMFAVGVDEMDWDDLNESHYDWPTVSQTYQYRQQVKQMVLAYLQTLGEQVNLSWSSPAWSVLMGIEHERIHLETSAAIIRQLPLQYITPHPLFVQCPKMQKSFAMIPKNYTLPIEAFSSNWDRNIKNLSTYGWDNQFGVKTIDVAAFKASAMLVSNGEFLQFMLEGGYSNIDYWTEQGQRWINSIKPNHPRFWVPAKGEQKYQLRTLNRVIEMPWDWPVEVNNLQARAFCNWKSKKLNKYIRLPTEDQYYAIRSVLNVDQPDWQYQSVGNINLEYWMSPNPVDMFPTKGIYDVVGNVWQHTITPIYPFAQFQIHPIYEDFTTPCFDERHDLIKGGSFISTGNEALYHARYAFRRHFYQFAGFRYIETDLKIEIDLHNEQSISDHTVEAHLAHHYSNPSSYVLETVSQIDKYLERKLLKKKAKVSKVLTVGCSVGRIPLELGKLFDKSLGLDYTTRYFQMSTRLKEKGFLKHKQIDIDLKKLGISADNVEFFQMNPQNTDPKKISNCDFILIDGYSLRQNKIETVLEQVLKLSVEYPTIFILTASGHNELVQTKAVQIVERCHLGEHKIEIEQQIVLQSSKTAQDYLPDSKGPIKFKLSTILIGGV